MFNEKQLELIKEQNSVQNYLVKHVVLIVFIIKETGAMMSRSAAFNELLEAHSYADMLYNSYVKLGSPFKIFLDNFVYKENFS